MTPNPDACPNLAAFRLTETGQGICLPHARDLVHLMSGVGVPVHMEHYTDNDPLPCTWPIAHGQPA